MGNFKLSFTTALFIFSFLLCLIVAVVFVDRSPRDEDEFGAPPASQKTRAQMRDDDSFDSEMVGRTGSDPKWKSISRDRDSVHDLANKVAREVNPSPSPSPTPVPNQAELPIDPRMDARSITPPLPAPTDTPQAIFTPNTFAGMSPEQVGKYLSQHGNSLPAASSIQTNARSGSLPSMAVPQGITGPATPAAMTPAPPTRNAPQYYPIQTNDPEMAASAANPPGFGSTSPGRSTTGDYKTGLSNQSNAPGGWTPTSRATPVTQYISRGTDSGRSSFMISQGRTDPNATPPPGMPSAVTNVPPDSNSVPQAGKTTPAPLLYPPGSSPTPSSGSNRWNLPPAPTLPGPPVRDPDRPQANASPEASPTPGSERSSTDSPSLAFSVPANLPPELQKKLGSILEHAVAAKVNDRTFSGAQAENWAKTYALVHGKKLTEDTKQLETRTAAKEWAAITALAEDARRQNISLSDDEIDKYAAMRPGFKPAAWRTAMKTCGFTPGEIDTEMRDIALSEKLVDEQMKKQYDDKAIQAIFDKNPKQFLPPRRFHVEEIFKARPEDPGEEEKTAAEMKRLQRQATGGADFGLLASQASEAPTKSNKGDMGWLDDKSDISPAMAGALLKLKPGEVSPVVLDSDGFHIYHLLEIRESKPGFEAGREQVVAELKDGLRDSAYKVALEHEHVEVTYEKNTKVAKSGSTRSRSSSHESRSRDESDNNRQQAASTSQQQVPAGFSPGVENSPAPLLRPYGSNPARNAPVASANNAAPSHGFPVNNNPAGSAAPANPNMQAAKLPVVRAGGTISAGKGATVQVPPGFSTYPGVAPRSTPEAHKKGFFRSLFSFGNHDSSK